MCNKQAIISLYEIISNNNVKCINEKSKNKYQCNILLYTEAHQGHLKKKILSLLRHIYLLVVITI